MNPTIISSRRREFLKTCGLTGIALVSGNRGSAEAPSGGPLFSAVGCSGALGRAAAIKEQGGDFLTVGTDDLLMPGKPDEAFESKLAELAKAPLPVLACNGFIRPAHLRCVGKDANHDEVLAWAGTALRRLKRAGGKFMVFGSGGSRRLKDGWTKQQGDAQFVSLLKRMGPLAEEHGVTVAIEQLQESECNFINRIADAARLIREAGHPNIRVLADLYHMARVGDTAEDLRGAMDVVVHVEIAEKEDRTYPGIKGDDFTPWFRVLKQAGYKGAISIEGRGTEEQLGPAFREIRKQAASI